MFQEETVYTICSVSTDQILFLAYSKGTNFSTTELCLPQTTRGSRLDK